MKFFTKADSTSCSNAIDANGKNSRTIGKYYRLICMVLLLLALSCMGNKSFATAWRTNTAGALNTPSNWKDVATGLTSPTNFTTAGDTWQIQNAMTLATSWTVGSIGTPTAAVTMISGGGITESGTASITIYGSVNFSSGTISSTSFGGAAMNIYGNASFSGTFKMTSSFTANTVTLSLPTASGTMLIDNSSTGTWSLTTITVASGSTAQFDNNFGFTGATGLTVAGTLIIPSAYVYNGSAGFTVSSSGTLQVANTAGINGAITTTGARNLNVGGNYVFNGTAAQVTGTYLPATISSPGSVTINNSAGVTLSQNTTLNTASTLTFTSGNLAIGGHTLIIDGAVSGMSVSNVFTGGSTSALTIGNGIGTLGTLYFDQTTPGTSNLFSAFTMSRAATTVTLGNSLSAGTLALTTGTVADGGNAISVSGNITGAGTSTGTGGITLTGSGTTISGVTLGKLTLNNSAGFSLAGSPTITGSLNFTSGILTTGVYTITVPGTSGAVSGAGASTYVNGNLSKTISGLSSVNYEVGDATDYTPVQLAFSAAGTAGSIAVKATGGLQPQISTSLINSAQVADQYWTITSSGAAGPATVTPTFTYNSADILGGSNATFVTQEYASGAWGSILATTNTSSPYTSTPTAGIALASLAGAYIVGNQDVPCAAPITGAGGTIAFPTTTATTGSVSFTNSTSSPTGYIVVASIGTLLGTPAAATVPTVGTSCCTNGTIVGVGAGTPVSISTLSPNTSYNISVFDYNNTSCTGGPIYDTISYLTGGTLLTCPGISTAITNGTITDSSIAINWTAPTNGATSYTVNVYTNAGLTTSATGYSVSYSGTSAIISGLGALTQYWYTVTGNNSSCNSVASASQTGTTLNAPCTGTPAGGTTVSTVLGVSGTNTFTLSLSGASNTLGLAYQWLSNSCGDSTSFASISVATNATYTTTESAGTFYRCNITCTNTGFSALSTPVFVAYASALTCTTGKYSTGCSSFGIGINSVTLSGACSSSLSDLTIGCPSGYYANHTSIAPVKVIPGGTYSGTINTADAYNSSYVEIWIDFNDNGSFDDAGEKLYTSPGPIAETPSTTAYSISIPAIGVSGVSYGTHHMRVREVYGTSGYTSCATETYGDMVDYLVQIIPSPVLTSNAPFCTGGSLTLTASPSSACGATYTWAGPGSYSSTTVNSNNTVSPAATAGTYSLTVSINGAASCPTTPATTNVVINPLPTITAAATPSPVCLGSTLTVNATPAGGSGTYSSYSWSGPGGFTASTQSATSASMSSTGAGVYSVTVTDNKGCTSSSPGTTASVSVVSLPTVTATANPTAVCAGYTLTLNATPSGGSGTYSSFAWNGPGGFTASAQNTTNAGMSSGGVGVYSVSVTDNNGCTSAAGTTASVTLNALPTVTATVTPTAQCAGATLTLNATPAGGSGTYTSYSWSGPGSFTASTANAINTGITSASAGVYSVSVTDNNGCTSTAGTTSAVTVNPLPVITATATPTSLCATATLTLNATPTGGGGMYVSFAWHGPGGFTSSAQNTTNAGITASGAGIYSVTVTDNNGCTSTTGTTTAVAVNALPTITATAVPAAVCAGYTLTLNATPSGGSGTYSSFTWYGPSGFSASSQNTTNPGMSSSGVGVYSVSVTDNNGCTSATMGTTASVSLNTLPTITATVTPTAICAGGTVTLNATPAGGSGTYSSYSWRGPGSFTASTQNASNTSITAAGAGIYSVSVTDNNGCTSVSPGTTASVTVNALPNISGFSLPSSTVPCPGFASTVNVNAGSLGSGAYAVTYNLTGANTATGHTASLAMTAGTGTFTIPGTDLANPGSNTLTVTSVSNSLGCNSNLSTGNTLTVSVNPSPAAIAGSTSICLLSIATLTDSTSAGTWSSSNSAVATIGSSTGFITGSAIGTAVITYTLPTGCIAIATEIVNPIPNIYNVTGGGSFCSSSPAVHVSLSGSDAGASYQVYVNGIATGSLVTGTGSIGTLDLGPQTISGTYTVIANPSATCARTMNDSVIVTNSLAPSVFTVTGGGSYCAGGAGVAVGVNYGQIGMSYQLYNGVTAVGSSVTGIGYPLSFGLETGAGTYTVIATNPANSCITNMTGSATININSVPSAITGTASVCVGLATGLSDATSGGSWSSSNAGVATVSASGGIVSGVGAGTVVITYTVPVTGCIALSQVTVNAIPAAPGASSVCSGTTITLTDASSGGTWASSNTTIASIGSATGVLTGGAATGTATIFYTVATGCNAVSTVTVNPLPTLNNVTGGGSYCASATAPHIGLNGSFTGINYQLFVGSTASGSPVAGTGSTLDFGAETGAGTYTVIATNTTTGCARTMAGSAAIAINPLPAVSSLTGGGSLCSGSAGVDISLGSTTSGISYQLYDASTPIGSAVSGTGSSHDFGLQTAAGTYGAIATNTVTGCYVAMSGNPVVTVLPLPAAYPVTGGGSYCSGGSGVHIFLSSSDAGVNYQVFNSGVSVSSTVAGSSGSSIDFGAFTTAGTYTVKATNAITGCSTFMPGSATVTVNPLPVATYSVTGGGGYCSGSSSTSSIGLSGSVSGTSYQLYLGGSPAGLPIVSTGGAINFGVESAGTYTVIATIPGTGCSAAMSGAASIIVNPLPAIFSVTGGGSYCIGSASTVHVGLNGSTTGVNYQLYNGTTAVAGGLLSGTGASLDFGALPVGSYTVKATSSAGCVNYMSGSVAITTNPLPSSFSVSATTPTSYCVGNPAPHVLLSGSVTGVTYNLLLAGGTIGSRTGTGAALDFGAQPASGSYTVTAITSATGCSTTMTGSASITANPLPISTYSVTGGGSYCAGGTGKVVGLSGSTSGISYQLYINGIATGTPITATGVAFSFPSQTAAGSYTIVATNTATSCTSNMTGSVSISTTPLPVVYNVTGGGGYCIGTTTGVHVGLSSSDPGFTYQLFISGTTAVGSPVTGTGGAIDFGAQTTTGTYTVVATNTSTSCTNNMFGSAVISTVALPTAYAISASGSYCLGGTGWPVTLAGSAVGVNYQLLRGGIPVGGSMAGTSSALNFGNQTIAGNYTVFATNTTGCGSNMTGVETISINPLPAVFNVTSTGTSYCSGDTGVHIGLSSSATGFSYQLYNAGVTDGTAMMGTGSALDFGRQTNGVYTVIATNSTTSCPNNMSGMVVVTVNPLPTPYAVTGGGNYCSGGTGLDVALANSNTGISYQLYVGGVPAGFALPGTGLPLHFGLQTTAGTYTVMATNTTTGCTQNMTGSVVISISTLPALHNVSGGGNYCIGGTGVDVYIDGSNTGVSYQLYNSGVPVGLAIAGTGSVVHFGLQTVAGTYTVVATSGASCTANMTGSVTVGISPLPAVYTVTGGGNYCPSGTGVHIGLSASQAGVHYQLFNDGVSAATFTGTGSSIDFGLRTDTGTYTVVATNPTTTCTNNMSGIVSIGYYPLPTAYNVTGGGSYCAGGTGLAVGTDGSDAGIAYQLYYSGAPLGAPLAGTGFPINFGFETSAGTYTVIATNSATTCNNSLAGGAAISINSLPDTFSVTGGGQYCASGTGVAVGLRSSGSGISYQLYEGGVASGLPVLGTGGAISFGMETTAGTYTAVATNTGTTCTQYMPGSASVAINPLPVAYPVTGGGNYCPGGAGTHIGLSNSVAGITYQLYNGFVAAGSTLPGTGSSLDFGLITTPGTYTVIAIDSATSCTANMSGSAIVGISPLPTVYTVSASANQYCAGSAGVNILLGGSNIGTNYQLYLGGSVSGASLPGTGIPLNFGVHTAGTYTVVATNAGTGCINNMAGSASVIVNSLPAVYAVAGGGNYCPGGSGVHIGLAGTDPGINYYLYRSVTATGDSAAGTGSAVDFGLQNVLGTYTIVAKNPVTGCSSNMTGSATVGLNALPVVNTVTGGGSYCASGTGVTIGLSGSSAGINYQLYYDSAAVGAPVAGTGTLLNFGLHTAAGTYTAVATNSASGCMSNMTGSATIDINALPTSFAISGGGNYCAGGPGLDIGLGNSTVGVNYQLYNGTTPSGVYLPGTGLPLDFGFHTATGSYTLVATDAHTGCTSHMSGTATIIVNPTPSAYNVTGGGNYCASSAGVHIGLSSSNGGIDYQLFNAAVPFGLPASGTGSSIDFGLLTTIGTYSVVATNPVTGCTSNMTGTATVTVSPLLTPSVTLSTSGDDTVCAGTSVTINTSVINGGSDPSYSWSVNGVPVSATGGSFTYAPAVGDIVSLTMTSDAICASPATAGNSLSLMVLPHGMPTVTISSSNGADVCRGTSVTYTQASAFGGSSPALSWRVNGTQESSAPSYSYSPTNGDVVTCVLTSDYRCRLATSAYSNPINMEVDVPVTPSVSVIASPGTNLPQGQVLTLTAAVTNEVASPSFQWYLNGEPIPGAMGAVYSTSIYSNLDSFSCVVTSGGGCSGLMGSNSAVIHVGTEGVNQVTSAGDNIRILPNPNNGVFSIKGTLGTTADETVSIEILDMLGQLIYSDKIMTHGGNIDQSIHLSNALANGMYVLNLRSANANDVFHVIIEQ